jgi:transposase InsO family protein
LSARVFATATFSRAGPSKTARFERSHRIDVEEFWGRESFQTFEAAEGALRQWERVYNELRFSMALKGRTPAEKLAAVLAAA